MVEVSSKQITIIGAGTMGHAIALVFAQHGYPVILCDLKQQMLKHALRLIESTLETLIAFKRLEETEKYGILNLIRTTTDVCEAVKEAYFIVEAIPEVAELKKKLFEEINQAIPSEAIIASNTSGLDIFNVVEMNQPERLLIAHWFSPPHIMPLVEVVPGEKTSSKTLSNTVELLKRLGKVPIPLKKFMPAFIVNRFQNVLNKTAFEMIDNGWATPEDVDMALKHTLGIKLPILGVLQALDFTGIDLIREIMKGQGVSSPYVETLVGQGALGAKTGKGFYDYAGQNELEILKMRDQLFLKMVDFLKLIDTTKPL